MTPTRSREKAYFAGTHRIVDPRETLAAIASKAPSFGVTRVANVTGLDYIGIPVVTTVRPNSRNLSVHQGKGLTLEAAKASAIMEALEWDAAEQPAARGVSRAAAAFAGAAFLLPEALANPGLRRDTVIPWVEGVDLATGRAAFVPEELVTTDFTLPYRSGFGWFPMSSNGLAAGNSPAEARLHALCELIERDAFALWRLLPSRARAGTRVDPRAGRDASVNRMMSLYDQCGMTVDVWDVTSDIDVPAFFCAIDDRYARPPFLGRFGGVGCHPNAAVALCRALSEAAQSRCTFIAGSRDDIPLGSYSAVGWRQNLTSLMAPDEGAPPAGVEAVRAVSFDTACVEDDVEALLGRLTGKGVETIVEVDLSRPEIGIACLRVVIPELEGMSDKLGYKPGERARRAMRPWN